MARSSAVTSEPARSVGHLRLVYDRDRPDAEAPSVLERGAPPHVVEFHHGYMCAASGELGMAADRLRRAIKIKPDFADAYFNLGVVLAEDGQLADAISAFRKAVEIDECFRDAQYNLSVLLARNGQFAEAVAAFKETINLDRIRDEAHEIVGILARSGNFPGVQDIPHPPETDADIAAAYVGLGEALDQSGQPQEALAVYREAAELWPDDPAANVSLGRALIRNNQFPEAVGSLQRIATMRPEDAVIRCELGLALALNGQVSEAIAACQKAIELKPDYGPAHVGLAAALDHNGQHQAALAALITAVEVEPDPERRHVWADILKKELDDTKVDESNLSSYAVNSASSEAAVIRQFWMKHRATLLQKIRSLADDLGIPAKERPAFTHIIMGFRDSAESTKRRSKAGRTKSRPKWEDRKGADAELSPPEFIAKHYAAEMATGTLHRGVIAHEDKPLAVKLASWLRSHPMPGGIDIPTKPEWNSRQLEKRQGAVRSGRGAVRPEDARLYDAARYRAKAAM